MLFWRPRNAFSELTRLLIRVWGDTWVVLLSLPLSCLPLCLPGRFHQVRWCGLRNASGVKIIIRRTLSLQVVRVLLLLSKILIILIIFYFFRIGLLIVLVIPRSNRNGPGRCGGRQIPSLLGLSPSG